MAIGYKMKKDTAKYKYESAKKLLQEALEQLKAEDKDEYENVMEDLQQNGINAIAPEQEQEDEVTYLFLSSVEIAGLIYYMKRLLKGKEQYNLIENLCIYNADFTPMPQQDVSQSIQTVTTPSNLICEDDAQNDEMDE